MNKWIVLGSISGLIALSVVKSPTWYLTLPVFAGASGYCFGRGIVQLEKAS